jgi:hypothetical protein
LTGRGDPEDRRTRRGGRKALLAAWLLLVAAVAAAVGYGLSRPVPAERSADLRMALPPTDAPVQTADRSAETARAGGDADTPPDAQTSAEAPASPATATQEATGTQEAAGTPESDSGQAPQDADPAEGDGAARDVGGDQATGPDRGNGPDRPNGAAPAAGDDAGATQTARAPAAPPAAPAQQPAWLRYARDMTPPEGIPKIAVVLRGVGLSSAQAEAAVDRLPGTISLSFSAYAMEKARAWAARARRQGHEVLVDLPMEPADYPTRDPGPQALMTDLAPARNLDRLDWVLAQVDQQVGVVAELGSRFLADRAALAPVLEELKARGLMYVDNGVVPDGPAVPLARGLKLPYAVADRSLDSGQVSRPAVEARLVEAERIARQQGLAVVLARPFPTTIDALEAWSGEVERRGFVLVPASQAALRTTGRTTANLR